MACSHRGQDYRAESIQHRIERLQTHNKKNNPVPTIEVLPFSKINYSAYLPQNRAFRGPASLPLKKAPSSYLKNLNNRKLYFLTLYNQYQGFAPHHIKNFPKLKHCPNFHNALLDYGNHISSPAQLAPKFSIDFKKRFGNFIKKVEPRDLLASYPEMALPISNIGPKPRVIDIIRNREQIDQFGDLNKVFYQAIGIHINRTYAELKQLCDTGHSENYYNYENLSTHIKMQGRLFKNNPKNIKLLLKTTVFANHALLQSLESAAAALEQLRKPSSAPTPVPALLKHRVYTRAISEKLNVKWFEYYFKALTNSRPR